MNKHLRAALLSLASASLASSVHAQEAQEQPYVTPSEFPQDVCFGDPHIHTRISADASLWGSTLGPEDTYRFGIGEEVTSFKGWKVKLIRPLDWMAISDHSDVWGFYERIADGDPYVLAEPEGVAGIK